MASRKRKNSTPNFFAGSHESNTSESSVHQSRGRGQRQRKLRETRRRQLLETLETRTLLAGPQLIGIQPNEGALIEDGTVRDTSPRVLTFGFDQDQVISAQSFDGIQISRAGEDGELGTNDDVAIEPGLITLGDPNQNEVVVRFAESLPDDEYRIEVFAFDDAVWASPACEMRMANCSCRAIRMREAKSLIFGSVLEHWSKPWFRSPSSVTVMAR